ncbi:hypothetical protein GE09DRAFT_1159575, partial [Coniochaeta sp. 2T2.1]
MPTVNCCLNGLDGGCHYGPGSRYPDEIEPDWSCIAHGQYINYVPGDTKLSAKFSPDMIKSAVENDVKQWGKVLAQVTHYMATFSSRYGFIITDAQPRRAPHFTPSYRRCLRHRAAPSFRYLLRRQLHSRRRLVVCQHHGFIRGRQRRELGDGAPRVRGYP